MPINRLILLVLLISIISTCKQRPKRKLFSASELESIRQEFNLPKDKTFILDTNYLHFLFSLDTSKYAGAIKNHYQPIQASYYNKAGQLASFHINCFAGIGVEGKGDLNWNQKNAFASFLPISVVPLDSILPLSRHLQFLKTFDNKPIDTTGFANFDYTVIIHWGSKWRPRDCQNLIEIIKKNSALAKDKTLNILYVNDDNIR